MKHKSSKISLKISLNFVTTEAYKIKFKHRHAQLKVTTLNSTNTNAYVHFTVTLSKSPLMIQSAIPAKQISKYHYLSELSRKLFLFLHKRLKRSGQRRSAPPRSGSCWPSPPAACSGTCQSSHASFHTCSSRPQRLSTKNSNIPTLPKIFIIIRLLTIKLSRSATERLHSLSILADSMASLMVL